MRRKRERAKSHTRYAGMEGEGGGQLRNAEGVISIIVTIA